MSLSGNFIQGISNQRWYPFPMQALIKYFSTTASQLCYLKMKGTMMLNYFINFRYYFKCKVFQIDHKCNAATIHVSYLVVQYLLFLFLVKTCTTKLPGLPFVEGNTSQTHRIFRMQHSTNSKTQSRFFPFQTWILYHAV